MNERKKKQQLKYIELNIVEKEEENETLVDTEKK